MKKEYSAIELFGYIILGLAISIPASFYSAWCILKIIEWFKLPFHFTLLQMYALGEIISLYTYTESKDEGFSKLVRKIFTRVFLLSFVLLIMYIIHLIA